MPLANLTFLIEDTILVNEDLRDQVGIFKIHSWSLGKILFEPWQQILIESRPMHVIGKSD